MAWTESQQRAIESRGKALLVSAGAGSGKTTVLTARIIAMLTNREKPRDISRMLIVTFTKAAAAELRDRISSALKKAVAADPKNRRLAAQQNALPRAKICTIDSFCAELVRRNFDALDLPASIRVADETESKALRASVMEEVINFYYDTDNGESDIANFAAFADNFVSDRDDRLSDIMLTLHEKTSTMPRGAEFISDCVKRLEAVTGADFLDSVYGKIIISRISDALDYFERIYKDACDHFTDGGIFQSKYLPAFAYDDDFIKTVKGSLNKSRGELSALFNAYSKPKLGAVKTDLQDLDCAVYRAAREEFGKFIDEIKKKYLCCSDDELTETAKKTAEICTDLYTLLKRFKSVYTDEKFKRGAVDFADLERFAYKLLVRDGNVTDEAAAIAEQYDEIFIDEYQDTNGLQDGIFSAIANARNRFMVGDVKQSIYGFRGATPEIFSDYRDTMGQNGDENGEAIFMSDNFRCDKSIIEFTNAVSGVLFKNIGGISYYDGDALIHGKTDNPEKAAEVEIDLIEKMGGDDDDNEGDDRETAFVCEKIRSLIDSGYRPRDIAVLLRSAKNRAAVYEDALSKLSLPCFNTVTRSFFENPEILLMLCLLNCIDNPARDIYLTGALKSPLFGVNLDELVRIRRHTEKGSLYDALREYTNDTDFVKGRNFLDALERYRDYAAMKPVDKLIWYIYNDTGITAAVCNEESGKNLRQANLMLLYSYARQFEKRSFHGLYSFINYINDIIAERESFPAASASSEDDDAVKIMTVHQSKGLEFPVVFICGAERSFNTTDSKQNLLFGQKCGCAVKLRDKSGFARFETPIRRAVADEITSASIAEEARILYVAMTRAKERLIITAFSSDPDALLDSCTLEAKYLSAYTLSKSPNYIKWILTALNTVNNGGFCGINIIKAKNDGMETAAAEPSETEKQAAELDRQKIDEYKKEIEQRFGFVYPHYNLTTLPAKLSVSGLYPGVIDENGDEAESEDERSHQPLERPKFMAATPSSATAAQKGTATHVFMQFADFNLVERHGVDEEIARLVSMRFILPSDAAIMYRDRLKSFFDSELYNEMRRVQKLWRETRFNIRLPASDFTLQPEKKEELADEFLLVQGVIDCFFIAEDGTVTLVDYKTDYIPPSIASDREAVRKMLAERHGLQLSYYRAACEHLTGRKVGKTLIYSFGISDAVEL